MSNKNTALILGAGASYNYGYPLGRQLKTEIVNILQGIYTIVELLNEIWQQTVRHYTGDFQDLKNLAFENLQYLRPDEMVTEKNLVDFLLFNCNIEPIEIMKFYKNLSRSHLLTIDTFLEERNELIKLGKILIAIAIMKHEDDKLLKDEPLQGKHWYKYLLNQLGTSWNSLASNTIKIRYNYTLAYPQVFKVF